MPIYAYRCASCGHAKDILQKMSDPVLTDCPACGAATFSKQVTAAGFQLKGSGWYATDFRTGSSSGEKPATAATDGSKTTDSAPAKSESASTSSAAAATPAPAAPANSAT